MRRRGRHPRLLTVLLAVTLSFVGSTEAAAKIAKTAVKELCTDTALRIPDGPEAGDFVGAIVSTGNTRKDCPPKLLCGYGGIPLGSLVQDVDVKLRVNHPSVADLEVRLVDPIGILTTLSARAGSGGSNLGAGGSGCRSDFTVLDDKSSLALSEAGPAFAPFAGRFQADQPLSLHNRTYGAGDWRFYFDDVVPGGSGVVEAIGLRLTYRYVPIRRGRHP
jgi:hypothetical protein